MITQRSAEFFVHPDYHRSFGLEVCTEVERYEEALRRRVAISALPILLYDPELGAATGDFWDLFSPLHRFSSVRDNGILDDNPDVHERFNQLMREQKVTGGVVHGSYLEACVEDFKAHLVVGNDRILSALPPGHTKTMGLYTGPGSVQFGVTLTQKNVAASISEFTAGSNGFSPQEFAPDAKIYYC